jgi:hypothetical protein
VVQGGNEVMLRRIVELVEEIDRLQARVEGRDQLARGARESEVYRERLRDIRLQYLRQHSQLTPAEQRVCVDLQALLD